MECTFCYDPTANGFFHLGMYECVCVRVCMFVRLSATTIFFNALFFMVVFILTSDLHVAEICAAGFISGQVDFCFILLFVLLMMLNNFLNVFDREQ